MRPLGLDLGARAGAVSTVEAASTRAHPPSVARALRKALRDFYDHSWRLAVLNSALSVCALAVLMATQFLPLTLALVLLAVALGPPAIALMHCAVTLIETDDLELADFARGLRLHWRRGLALGSLAAAFLVMTAIAFVFYAGETVLGWSLAILVLYLTGLFGVFQLSLWPLSVVERELPLRRVLRNAALVAARRPGATVGLGVALLLVNVVGVAAAVLPFLTMTIAYSFLAAAHFVLPQSSTREA
jgi:MFS family permease